MFEIYAVSISIDPRKYNEFLLEDEVNSGDLDSRMRFWNENIDRRNYGLVYERS